MYLKHPTYQLSQKLPRLRKICSKSFQLSNPCCNTFKSKSNKSICVSDTNQECNESLVDWRNNYEKNGQVINLQAFKSQKENQFCFKHAQNFSFVPIEIVTQRCAPNLLTPFNNNVNQLYGYEMQKRHYSSLGKGVCTRKSCQGQRNGNTSLQCNNQKHFKQSLAYIQRRHRSSSASASNLKANMSNMPTAEDLPRNVTSSTTNVFRSSDQVSSDQECIHSMTQSTIQTTIQTTIQETSSVTMDANTNSVTAQSLVKKAIQLASPQCRQVPKNTFYKRPLPSHLVAFSSEHGKILFKRALEHGHLASFYKLIEQYHTQNDIAFCGLTSICMILNALSVDPGKKWRHPWRWWAEELLECCTPMDSIRQKGITVQEFYCIASCNGLSIEYWNGETTDLKTFLSHVQMVTSEEYRLNTGDEVYMVCSFSRKTFQQTGSGHYAPVAAYSPWKNESAPVNNNGGDKFIMEEDKVLLLDTAKFKYPSFFVSLKDLHESMRAHDCVTNAPRGYFLIRRNSCNESLFLQLFQSCQTKLSFRRFVLVLCEKSAQLIETLNSSELRDMDVQSSLFAKKFRSLLQSFHKTVKNDAILSHHFEKYSAMLQSELNSCETHQSALKSLFSDLQNSPIYDHVKKALEDDPLLINDASFEGNAWYYMVMTVHISSMLPGYLFTNISSLGTNDQILQLEFGSLRRYMQGHMEDLKHNRFAFYSASKTQMDSQTMDLSSISPSAIHPSSMNNIEQNPNKPQCCTNIECCSTKNDCL